MTTTLRPVRGPLAVIGALACASVVRAVSVWDRLPVRMASHFGSSGRPDGWSSRGGYFLVIGLVGAGTTLVLVLAPLWLRKVPTGLINLPNREHWLAPARRDASLARLGAWCAWLGALTFALLAAVHELALRANLARGPLPSDVATGLVVAYLAASAVMVILLYRAFRLPRAPA